MKRVSPTTLAIIVKGWPRLSETFIAQELLALQNKGLNFEIWSLRFPTDSKIHPLHQKIKAPVYYLPEYLHKSPWRVLKALIRARKLSGFRTAWQMWCKDFKRDKTRNRIRRFGQACVLATEMSEHIIGLYAHFLHTPASVARYGAILREKRWAFSAHAKDIWTSPEWEKREKMHPDMHGAVFGTTCTAYGAKYLRKHAQKPETIMLNYHGLDLSRFPAPPERAEKNPEGSIRFLSVGRMVEKKGIDRLIAAFALLPKDMEWRWAHIGDGPLRKALESQAHASGFEDRISWLGVCDQLQVIEAMRQADLFILPSRVAKDGDRDGLPNVLMEAASQKLPILATSVSAIPEFIVSGTHGLLVDDTPEELAEAIVHLTQNPDKRAAFGNAAYTRLIKDFGSEAGIKILHTALLNLCENH